MSLTLRKPAKPAGRAAKLPMVDMDRGEGVAPAAVLHLPPPGPVHPDNMQRPVAINDWTGCNGPVIERRKGGVYLTFSF